MRRDTHTHTHTHTHTQTCQQVGLACKESHLSVESPSACCDFWGFAVASSFQWHPSTILHKPVRVITNPLVTNPYDGEVALIFASSCSDINIQPQNPYEGDVAHTFAHDPALILIPSRLRVQGR